MDAPDDFVIILLTKKEKEALYNLAEKEHVPSYLFLNGILKEKLKGAEDGTR